VAGVRPVLLYRNIPQCNCLPDTAEINRSQACRSLHYPDAQDMSRTRAGKERLCDSPAAQKSEVLPRAICGGPFIAADQPGARRRKGRNGERYDARSPSP
jgi:hypothetical protein